MATTTQPTKPTTTPTTKLPIRRFTQPQLQECRALGLCYNCDEKFIPGHKCNVGRFLLLLEDNETEVIERIDEQPAETDTTLPKQIDTYFHLSTQALTGQYSPQTLKFQGKIGELSVMVLIDTGSTHNILQPRIASHLNLSHNCLSWLAMAPTYIVKACVNRYPSPSKLNNFIYPFTYFPSKEPT